MAYDRTFLQGLAQLRLNEAKLLFQAGQWAGAYYIAGYAIECAFKARLAGQFQQNEIPDRNLVNRIYTHDLTELLRLAGLEAEFDTARQRDPELERRWSIVKNWNEQARYSIWTEQQARAIIDAIDGTTGSEGMLQWLSARW